MFVGLCGNLKKYISTLQFRQLRLLYKSWDFFWYYFTAVLYHYHKQYILIPRLLLASNFRVVLTVLLAEFYEFRRWCLTFLTFLSIRKGNRIAVFWLGESINATSLLLCIYLDLYSVCSLQKAEGSFSGNLPLFNPPIKNFEINWAEIATGAKPPSEFPWLKVDLNSGLTSLSLTSLPITVHLCFSACAKCEWLHVYILAIKVKIAKLKHTIPTGTMAAEHLITESWLPCVRLFFVSFGRNILCILWESFFFFNV